MLVEELKSQSAKRNIARRHSVLAGDATSSLIEMGNGAAFDDKKSVNILV